MPNTRRTWGQGWRPARAAPHRTHLRSRAPPSCAGKYVTGDINEAYLRNLEEQGRGKRSRPARKASLVGAGGGVGGGARL